MEDTRLAILQFLQRQDAPIAWLTSAMGMAPATIRRHLDILQRDGLVAYRVLRRKQGRPKHVFYLTDVGQETMPRRYTALLRRVLGEMDNPDAARPQPGAGSDSEMLFARIAKRLASEYGEAAVEASGSDRLELLLQVLAAEQFDPRLERANGGLRVHLQNCPFRGVAMDNPAVCALDRELIARLLGLPVASEERIDRGDHHCTSTVTLNMDPLEPPIVATPAGARG